MGRKPWNWFKRLFSSDAQSNSEKKEKRRKWFFFDVKNKPPSITAKLDDEKEEDQEKVTVEVTWLSRTEKQQTSPVKPQDHAAADSVDGFSILRYQRDLQEFAATRIQSAFRGFLARKALRALKGIVMLQAIIRGRNVRRQAITTLKCLQSLVNIQSQASAASSSSRRNSFPMVDYNETSWQFDEPNKQLQYLKDKIIKCNLIRWNSQRRWDSSILTKEDADALFVNKREAAIKRERIKGYSFCHRSSSDSDRSKPDGKFRQWLVEWEDKQIDKEVIEEEEGEVGEDRAKHLKLRGLRRQYQNHTDQELNSPLTSRRSLQQRKQASCSYMAATESAKAKVRSLSSPRVRPGSVEAYNSDGNSPYKSKRLFLAAASNGRNSSSYYCYNNQQQRSPSLKSLPAGGMRSNNNRTQLKDLSIDSGCSFKTWDPQCAF